MEYLILQAEENQLVVAHFGISRRSTELIGAAVITLDEERSLSDAVRSIAEKMTGSPRVVLCLPPALFAQRTVALPFNDLRKVREVLPAQLQGEIVQPVEELIIDALPAGEGRFLALWARKSEISLAVDTFRAAGIEPQAVSAHHFAWRFIPGVPPDCALYDGSVLAVINNGAVIFFRAVAAVEAATVIPATLAALESVGTALPAKLCLFGAGVAIHRELESLPLAVELLQPPDDTGHLFKNTQVFHDLASASAVALACHAAALPDFRRGELAWTAGDDRLRKKLLLTVLLSATIIVLLFVSKGLQYRATAADTASLNKSIASMYREIFPARAKAVDEISEVKGEIRKLSGIENSSAYLDLLKKLAEAKGSTINGLYEAELEGRNLRLKGDARSAQAVNEFKTALAALFASSELGEVKSRPDGTVTFTLAGTLKEGLK